LICIGIFPAVLFHHLSRVLAALLATQPMLGFSLWCAGCRLQGRRLSVAKPADTPLLTAKYEPDITVGGVLQAKL